MARLSIPRWGAMLAELRHTAKLSAADVVQRLSALGIAFDRSTVYAYESGRVAAPDAAVVWGLARVYEVPHTELVDALVSARTGTGSTKAIRPTSTNPIQLSAEERALLQTWRRLTPQARKLCRAFIDFQLGATSGEPSAPPLETGALPFRGDAQTKARRKK